MSRGAGHTVGMCGSCWVAAFGLTLLVPTASGLDYDWGPLGTGISDTVVTTTVYDGALIAGGEFTTAGGVPCHYIARWDGSTWQPLGSGMNDMVYALVVYNGDLIAGGEFTTAGGVPCNYIARWDGNAWAPLGSGMSGGTTPYVFDLAEYNGELIAGGFFTKADEVVCNRIARWDGNAWHALGSGVNAYVHALGLYNGDLIVGGRFTAAGTVPCPYIARWDGSAWHPLGTGMGGGALPCVLALTVYSNELIAGGYDFTLAGGVPCHYIARWNGSNWQALGSGMDSHVWTLTVDPHSGELIAGGEFLHAGDAWCGYLARWNGSAWQGLSPGGMSCYVYSLGIYPLPAGALIVGGCFTGGGTTVANRIAWAKLPCLGDLNCDGVVDFADINPFVQYLTNFYGWRDAHLDCDPAVGDINDDGSYPSFADINPFVDLITHGQGPCP